MKILILADITAPYRIEVFKQLSEEFEITVFFNYAKNESRNAQWFANSGDKITFEILNNEKAIESYDNTIKNIREYDVVLCYDPWAKRSRKLAKICMRKKIPYILNADGALGINLSFPKKQIKTYYVKRAAKCFAGCERACEYFRAYGAKEDQIVKHPFTSVLKEQLIAAPYTKEQKLELRNELGIDDKMTFITVGQFIHRKGFDLLLNAWKNTKQESQLLIIGGGPLEDEYLQFIKANELKNVHVIGFKKPEELRKYYLASDVYVMSTREDIWGLVINEAMACALPIITSNKCTAGNELVENGVNGNVYECEDFAALAKLIDEYSDNPSVCDKYALNAIAKGSEYCIENIAKCHIDCIKKLKKD